MDQRRMSAAQPAPSLSFLLSEDSLYDLLQENRFSTTTTSTTSASPTTSTLSSGAVTSLSDIPARSYSHQDSHTQFITTFDQIAPAPAALKMEPEIGDFISNSYNWMPTTQLYNVDSLSCLTTYNTNHLSQQLPNTSQFAYTPPPPPGPTSPQIQALRDFMVYGNLANPTMPSPQFSSAVSSRATTPVAANSLFYQLDDVGTDSLLGISPAVQSKPQDMNLAYRTLCTEIYATERSPHRSQFQRENHILAERQRREEMNEKFSALRAMIPKATKKDKASIVGDTIDYVLELEKRLKQLQACKDTASGSLCFKSRKRKSPSTSTNTAPVHQESPPNTSNPGNATDHQCANPPTRTSSPSSSSPVREGHSAVNSPSDQIPQEPKQPGKNTKAPSAEVDVQNLGNQAVIKIVCERRPGHVLSVLNALEECKVEVMQSNVMTVGESSIHFVTVQVEEGASAPTEELVSAILQAINVPADEP